MCDIKRDTCPDIASVTKNMRNETSEGVKGVMGNLVEGRISAVGPDH